MEHFQVDADFFLDAAVNRNELVSFLFKECQNPDDEDIHKIIFEMDSPDSIDIRFVVESNSYESATRVARKFLSGVEGRVTRWLRDNSAHSSIEDESLLLMPA